MIDRPEDAATVEEVIEVALWDFLNGKVYEPARAVLVALSEQGYSVRRLEAADEFCERCGTHVALHLLRETPDDLIVSDRASFSFRERGEV